MKKTLIWLVTFYQQCVSPYILPRCRFYPTCSEYMKQALLYHGVFKGTLLTFLRVCRCNPFFKGGVDLVSVKNKKGGV